jgi:WD40 repeat protein
MIRPSIKVWDTATTTCIATFQGHTSCVSSLCLSFKINRLISASEDKTIRVWDTTTNTCDRCTSIWDRKFGII